VTYNIHGWRDTFHHDNLARVTALLTRLDADVIALQEVLHPYRPPSNPAERATYFDLVKSGKGNGFEASTPSWGNGSRRPADSSHHGDADARPYLDELAAALGMTHVSFGRATEDGYFGRFGYGNAVLSRRPIAREEHLVVRPATKHQVPRAAAWCAPTHGALPTAGLGWGAGHPPAAAFMGQDPLLRARQARGVRLTPGRGAGRPAGASRRRTAASAQ
jgi:hypothetical protein